MDNLDPLARKLRDEYGLCDSDVKEIVSTVQSIDDSSNPLDTLRDIISKFLSPLLDVISDIMGLTSDTFGNMMDLIREWDDDLLEPSPTGVKPPEDKPIKAYLLYIQLLHKLWISSERFYPVGFL